MTSSRPSVPLFRHLAHSTALEFVFATTDKKNSETTPGVPTKMCAAIAAEPIALRNTSEIIVSVPCLLVVGKLAHPGKRVALAKSGRRNVALSPFLVSPGQIEKRQGDDGDK